MTIGKMSTFFCSLNQDEGSVINVRLFTVARGPVPRVLHCLNQDFQDSQDFTEILPTPLPSII